MSKRLLEVASNSVVCTTKVYVAALAAAFNLFHVFEGVSKVSIVYSKVQPAVAEVTVDFATLTAVAAEPASI